MKEKIEIEIKRLKDIARYYEFPLAIFFGGSIPKGTRRDAILGQITELRKKLEEEARTVYSKPY